ncbi:protein SPT2 homolog [Lytechinus pictus]|uniref:protein SPT2 homolog n=1 Tax=Lytechinus pictus TaxID=7653 RepID=UPI0030B9FF6B
MEFQKILELATKNQKVAEKKLTETKRYSSAVPPPKKEPRPNVDPDAIRARIEQKEKYRKQKLIDEEREKKEGAKRQIEAERKFAEEKRNNRKASRKAKTPEKAKRKSSTASEESSRRQEPYRDKEHEVVHKTFMQNVEKDSERHRQKVAKKEKREMEARPSRPKLSKKPPPAPKKPMSYEELLKFAEQQKTVGSSRSGGRTDEEEEDSEEDSEEEEEESEEEEEYERRPRDRVNQTSDRSRDQMRIPKMKDRSKDERPAKISHGQTPNTKIDKSGRPPLQSCKKDKNRHLPDSVKDNKGHRNSRDIERTSVKRANGHMNTSIHVGGSGNERRSDHPEKFTRDKMSSGHDRTKSGSGSKVSLGSDKKQVNRAGERPKSGDRSCRSGDKPTGKHNFRPASKTNDKVPQRLDGKGSVRPGARPSSSAGRTESTRPESRPHSKPVPSKPPRTVPGPGPGKPPHTIPGKSSGPVPGRASGPVSSKQTRPIQDARSRDQHKLGNHIRERPRPSGMGPPRGPPRGPEVSRKRPAKPPIMHVKRGRLIDSDEESDYDDGDGFIDDTPLDNSGSGDVSSYIKEIFGYDKSKYEYESDYALRSMDTSYKDIQREEARSSRLGMLEDLEDMRQEKEEMKRKAMKKGKKR